MLSTRFKDRGLQLLSETDVKILRWAKHLYWNFPKKFSLKQTPKKGKFQSEQFPYAGNDLELD